jgi:hypothetical protein
LQEIRAEQSVTQAIEVDLDREQQDERRGRAAADYALAARLEELERRIADLQLAAESRR